MSELCLADISSYITELCIIRDKYISDMCNYMTIPKECSLINKSASLMALEILYDRNRNNTL